MLVQLHYQIRVGSGLPIHLSPPTQHPSPHPTCHCFDHKQAVSVDDQRLGATWFNYVSCLTGIDGCLQLCPNARAYPRQ